MVDNVGRKITFLAIVLGISLAFLLIPSKPFQMGLDLQGGTRLTYSFDFDEAVEQGQITPEEAQNPFLLLSQTVTIIRERLDPNGLLEAVIRQEGGNRIVIELPGSPDVSGSEASSTLAVALDGVNQLSIELPEGGAGVVDFPETGGVVQLDGEKIRYGRRDGNTLQRLERGYYGTEQTAHAAGAVVELSNDDAIRRIIEDLGELEFLIEANPNELTLLGTDPATEQQKLAAWVASNPGIPIVEFNDVDEADGGPNPGIKWRAFSTRLEEWALAPELDRARMMLIQEDEDYQFVGSDVSSVFPSSDNSGLPAVGFEMQASRKGDFGDFTGEYEGRMLCITLNDQIESYATILDRLPGRGIIRGDFEQQDVRDLVTVIRSGSLPIKPTLENEEVVGPSLGKDYASRGTTSGIAAILAVLAFMVFYYRRLGLVASVGLVTALVILMGGLAFLHATVTLPGIAGIILTVGMAVDANILIFDRIREEMDKGQNTRQASKTGFDRAFSAIFDANITTLLTALILYKIGTGPIKGFAVTLSIGIIASMIQALVLTRLLVHWQLEKGVKAFPMGKWLVNAKFDFLSKAKVALAASSVLIVGGIALFAMTPNEDRFGIDFLGGAEIQINTETAHDTDAIRQRVQEIPGEIGESAVVKEVSQSAEGDGYTSFRITFKVSDEARGTGDEREGGAEKDLQNTIREHMGDLLQRGPIEISNPVEAGASTTWDVALYFEDPHPVADLHGRLTDTGLQAPAFTQSGDGGIYRGTLQTPVGQTASEVETSLNAAFSNKADTNGVAFDLSKPIPSASLVSPQVVGDLRNKAVIALAVSLFAVVMYIRVRFAEYSYGFAAVAALTHDVLITLGMLTLAGRLGIVSGEINLPMVAAFLTIIGYSLNDTIVIFDRVRENLPRMKKPLSEILNLSINQTLSRTLLTSLTTLVAVSLLFFFNLGTGNVLEGFAFAMLVGVVTGTYSTIFIANPVLLWLEGRNQSKGQAPREKGGPNKAADAAV